MPQKAKGPRLYFVESHGRNGAWCIRDFGKKFSTGCGLDERDKAEEMLAAYIRGDKVGEVHRRTLIYFVTAADEPGYPIKIGWAAGSVSSRLSTLQIGNPHRLICLGTVSGTVSVEREIHQRFAEHHLRGEWFTRTPELLRFIQQRSEQPR